VDGRSGGDGGHPRVDPDLAPALDGTFQLRELVLGHGPGRADPDQVQIQGEAGPLRLPVVDESEPSGGLAERDDGRDLLNPPIVRQASRSVGSYYRIG
jgi:hypothetical protein